MSRASKILEQLGIINEGKASYGDSEGYSYAVQINTLSNNEYFKLPFGRAMSDMNLVNVWLKSEGIKTFNIDSKGKPTMKSVKEWVKQNKPTEFYARWKKDSSSYKDDSVEINYK